jgi:hypothetical protein
VHAAAGPKSREFRDGRRRLAGPLRYLAARGDKNRETGTMFEGLRPGARASRNLRHWGTELAIVAAGVLLALWAQAWFEGRQESDIHRETVAQMDGLFGRALVQTSARVASSQCAIDRIAALDNALRASDGQWRAMPLTGLPEGMVTGHYPPVYLVDTDVLPLQIFDTARGNGTLAALAADDQRFYERVERQLNWLNDVWLGSGNPTMQLSLLGVDGPLGETMRDEMRQALAWLDNENRVTMLRAGSLARLARERGFVLPPENLETYRGKIERDQRLFGECVVADLDPLQLTTADVVQKVAP